MQQLKFKLKFFGLTILSLEYSTENKEIEQAPEMTFHNLKTSNVSTASTGTIRPDLKELEKKLTNQEEVPDPIKVKCSSCEGITYDDDIDFCSKCGKEICSNCGSTDTDGKKYCSLCWTIL